MGFFFLQILQKDVLIMTNILSQISLIRGTPNKMTVRLLYMTKDRNTK